MHTVICQRKKKNKANTRNWRRKRALHVATSSESVSSLPPLAATVRNLATCTASQKPSFCRCKKRNKVECRVFTAVLCTKTEREQASQVNGLSRDRGVRRKGLCRKAAWQPPCLIVQSLSLLAFSAANPSPRRPGARRREWWREGDRSCTQGLLQRVLGGYLVESPAAWSACELDACCCGCCC